MAYAQTPTSATSAVGPDCTREYCALTTVPGAFDACKVDKNGVVTCEKDTVKNPVSVIKNIYGISIGIGAMLAIVMIIWAGIEYATTEAIYGKSAAKEKWQGAVFGLVLLLASYIILRTINVDLVNINLDLGTPIKCTPTKDTDGKDIPCGASADALKQMINNMAKNISDLNADLTIANRNITDKQEQLKVLQAQNPPNLERINQLKNEIKDSIIKSAIIKIDALQTTADRQILTKLSSSNPERFTDARNAISISLDQQQKVIDGLVADGNGINKSEVQNLTVKLNENKAVSQSNLRQIGVYQVISDTISGSGNIGYADLQKIIDAKTQWDNATDQTKKELAGNSSSLQNFNKELDDQRIAASQLIKTTICNNSSAKSKASQSQEVATQLSLLCPAGGGGKW
ncbi:MAG: hypothetical protein AAB922_01735 [Patescibacteria group bacterium]